VKCLEFEKSCIIPACSFYNFQVRKRVAFVLFDTLVCAASVRSEAIYGQFCGQKYLPRNRDARPREVVCIVAYHPSAGKYTPNSHRAKGMCAE